MKNNEYLLIKDIADLSTDRDTKRLRNDTNRVLENLNSNSSYSRGVRYNYLDRLTKKIKKGDFIGVLLGVYEALMLYLDAPMYADVLNTDYYMIVLSKAKEKIESEKEKKAELKAEMEAFPNEEN